MAVVVDPFAPKFVSHIGETTLDHIKVWCKGLASCGSTYKPIGSDKYTFCNVFPPNIDPSSTIVLNVYAKVKHCTTCCCVDCFFHLETVMVAATASGNVKCPESQYVNSVKFMCDGVGTWIEGIVLKH